jgi:hypothetical protein
VQGNRWADLIERFSDLAPDLRNKLMEMLVTNAADIADDDSRILLQQPIRKLVSHHREYHDADWALPEADLANLERAYHALTPTDLLKSVAWLFEADMALLLHPPGHEWEARRLASDAARAEALQRVYARLGMDGVMTLALMAKTPAFVGMALAEIADDAATRPILTSTSFSRQHTMESSPWLDNRTAEARQGPHMHSGVVAAVLTILLLTPATTSAFTFSRAMWATAAVRPCTS